MRGFLKTSFRLSVRVNLLQFVSKVQVFQPYIDVHSHLRSQEHSKLSLNILSNSVLMLFMSRRNLYYLEKHLKCLCVLMQVRFQDTQK